MELITCTPKRLPVAQHVEAARAAIKINPANRPLTNGLVLAPAHEALLTSKYWGSAGVHLTVSFLEDVAPDLAARIVSHMNAWSPYGNVHFTLVASGGQVRITLKGDGYWSNLGTDILQIEASQPTMSLQAFAMDTPESEYRRVVRHETGHTLGFIHEHLRREIIAKLLRDKTLAWGETTLGWSAAMVTAQILTPPDDATLTETPQADENSIMCYQLPGSITVDGQPIPGGTDIDPVDQAFVGKLYPLSVQPPPPPPPGPPPLARDYLRIDVPMKPGPKAIMGADRQQHGVLFLSGPGIHKPGTYLVTPAA